MRFLTREPVIVVLMLALLVIIGIMLVDMGRFDLILRFAIAIPLALVLAGIVTFLIYRSDHKNSHQQDF